MDLLQTLGDTPLAAASAALYLCALALLGAWGLHRLVFLNAFRTRRRPAALGVASGRSDDDLPHVTVQLPLFNERTVVEGLIRAAGRLDWPRDRLEIQVLDDSTDETRELVDAEVARLVAGGIDATVVRRTDRRGYKAGALAAGLHAARGELIAVFDADFTPPRSFLRDLVGGFDDPRVGMVQARWTHRNRDESPLTRAQAVLLDGHFVIEHRVRHDLGVFFNFNGTAGVWRREAIDSAGGWQHDTLTEDLDLSYRSQLSGWKFRYAPAVECPAEVPPDIAAFKSQQHRWARGSVQVARKLVLPILRSDERPRIKLEAVSHLAGNCGYPLVVLLAVLLPLALTWSGGPPTAVHAALFVLCTLSVFVFYDTCQRALGRTLVQRALDVPAAVMLGLGISWAQTKAVLGGLRRRTGEFVRTPKRGHAPAAHRYSSTWTGLPVGELALAAWNLLGALAAVQSGRYGALPFLALFSGSFAWVGLLTLQARFVPTPAAPLDQLAVSSGRVR